MAAFHSHPLSCAYSNISRYPSLAANAVHIQFHGQGSSYSPIYKIVGKNNLLSLFPLSIYICINQSLCLSTTHNVTSTRVMRVFRKCTCALHHRKMWICPAFAALLQVLASHGHPKPIFYILHSEFHLRTKIDLM